jgi:hypothetical protein
MRSHRYLGGGGVFYARAGEPFPERAKITYNFRRNSFACPVVILSNKMVPWSLTSLLIDIIVSYFIYYNYFIVIVKINTAREHKS